MSELNRMLKQRQDSLAQFSAAGRTDLADQERFEIEIVRGFMPDPVSDNELATIIDEAIKVAGAQAMKDMGKVMGMLKQKLNGRADMGAVSVSAKARLTG